MISIKRKQIWQKFYRCLFLYLSSCIHQIVTQKKIPICFPPIFWILMLSLYSLSKSLHNPHLQQNHSSSSLSSSIDVRITFSIIKSLVYLYPLLSYSLTQSKTTSNHLRSEWNIAPPIPVFLSLKLLSQMPLQAPLTLLPLPSTDNPQANITSPTGL